MRGDSKKRHGSKTMVDDILQQNAIHALSFPNVLRPYRAAKGHMGSLSPFS